MPILTNRYNWGSKIAEQNPGLYNQLSDSYQAIALVVNTKISVNIALTSPPADDPVNRNFSIGDDWVNTTTDESWKMTSRTSDTAVTWSQFI